MAKQKKIKDKHDMSSTPKGVLQQPQRRAITPFDEMDRLFDSFFSRGWMHPVYREWPALTNLDIPFDGGSPKVDVLERDAEVVVRAELPGVDKDNLELSVTSDSVTIKATTEQESKEEKGDYHRREISRGSFVRTVALPVSVQSKQAKARFKDGVLELTLPKAAPAERHSIKVD